MRRTIAIQSGVPPTSQFAWGRRLPHPLSTIVIHHQGTLENRALNDSLPCYSVLRMALQIGWEDGMASTVVTIPPNGLKISTRTCQVINPDCSLTVGSAPPYDGFSC